MPSDDVASYSMLPEEFRSGLLSGLDALPEVSILFDRDGTIVHWSPRAEWHLGWPANRAIGSKLNTLVIEDDHWTAIQEAIAKDWETSQVRDEIDLATELEIHRANETSFPASGTLSRVKTPADDLFLLVVTDLNARKRMEKYISRLTLETRLLHQATTLASESESFTDALQHCVDIICEVTRWELGLVYFVEPTCKSLQLVPIGHWDVGQNIREFRAENPLTRGMGLPGLVWESEEPRWLASLERDSALPTEVVRESGLQGAFAFPVMVRSEVIAVLEFFSTEQIEPDPQLLLMVRNLANQLGRVIERRRSQEQDARLAAVVGSTYDAIISRDLGDCITSWNQGAYQIYGYTEEEVLGRHIGLIVPNGDEEEPEIRQAIRTGTRLIQFETVRQRKDGRYINVSLSISPVSDQDGRVVGWCTIERDISERSKADRELRRAKTAAEAANQAKNQFLANISHELRTPMNAIIGMTDLALDDELTSAVRNYLTTARASAGTLLYLLNDLLDFSRMEAGRFQLDEQPFSLRESIDELMKLMAVRANEKGLELIYQIDPIVPDTLRGDPQRLRQILVNLISNAIKFTDAGEVVVRCEAQSVEEQLAVLHFSVSDTGIGIPQSERHRIFSPFMQVDSTTTRKYSGSGLGLAICRQLSGLMRGELWLESQVDIGSTFHFTVRLSQGEEGHLSDGSAAASDWPIETLPQYSVLVVDDSPTSREILEHILNNYQMEVVIASSGEEAMTILAQTKARRETFSLAIIDALMPEIDGLSLIDHLNQLNLIDYPPILMLASADRQLIGEQVDAHQGIALLEKPVSRSALLDAIFSTIQGTPAESVPTTDPTEVSARSMKILVAEDTPANQKVVEAILHKLGHRFVLAQNGREAVNLVQNEPFDLVLMDIQMPTMDGLQATNAIRRLDDPAQAQIPILAMTAHARKEDRDRCLAAEMDGYISKPFEFDELKRLLVQLSEEAHHQTHRSPTKGTVKEPGGGSRSEIESADPEDSDNERSEQPSPIETGLPDDRPVLDEKIALTRLGSRDLFNDLVGFYREDVDKMMLAIRNALKNGVFSEAERLSHSLKSNVAMFEANPARDAAQALEDFCEREDLTAAETAWTRLRAELDRLTAALDEYPS